MMNNLQNHSQQRSSVDEIYHTADYSSQYHPSDVHRCRRDDAFGEFPTQMIATTPDTTTSTPLTTNRRADNQFTQDSDRLSEMRSNRVLILGGSERSKNHRQLSSSSSSSFVNTPNIAESEPKALRLLDYSMITTPGAVGTRGSCCHEEKTKGVVHWASGTPFSNILRGVVSSTPGSSTDAFPTPYTAARELLLNNKSSTGESSPVMDSLENTTQNNNFNNGDNNNMENTALAFAKSAPLSGYLRKLGKNIPTFKRRFFVLKPSTHLYYFISPNDVEPRGCIDLDIDRDEKNGKEGCVVKEIGSFPDGTFRFELTYDEEAEPTEDRGSNSLDENDTDAASRPSQTSSRRRNFRRQSIVLEARSEEMGREWMAKLQSERLSTARSELNSLQKTLEDMKSNNLRWESSAYEEALRADEAERQRNTAISDARSWEKKFVNLNEAIRLLVKNKSCNSSCSSSSSKQEGTSSCIVFLTETVEDLDVKGTNFDELSEAFHTIHNDYNELSKREDTFNDRIADLEKRATDAESRAIKAETELSKIVEEYKTTQIELKKTKREKKILVKEVRSRHAASMAQLDQHALSSTQSDQNQNDLQSNNSQHSNTAALTRPNNRMKEEERRLVIELEEHVMSGLRLSDQFLTLNGIDPSEILDDLDNSVQASSIHDAKSTLDRSPQRPPTHQNSEEILLDLSPIPGYRAGNDMVQRSLLDKKDDESADDTALVSAESKPVTPYFSSNCGDRNNDIDLDHNLRNVRDSTHRPDLQNHDFKQYYSPSSDVVHQHLNSRFIDTSRQQETTRAYQSTHSTCRRKEGSEDPLDMASSASESSRSRVTDNGLATTKLECPLNDVEETAYHHRNNRTIGDDGNVYHITFYSNKIGLQFQKVPNEPQSGLLTEAMTADHGPNVGGANKTTAELRRIASISQHTQRTKGTLPMVCLPATPADAVLVCGVVGFDESCGNTPPQIGARLVAFDGIPVEVGKWTFESIRKSILARGRPMTLSFRNDFLTPKQRTILTKAVKAVPPPTTASVRATHSSSGSIIGGRTDTNASTGESTIVRSTSSISSQRSSQPKSKYYSFSEAGSSISSAVAPLVSNLLSNSLNASIGKNQEDVQFAPSYMKRASDSLEEMRRHHDFQSGLL